MPTWNRRRFIPAAVDCFLKQTYENRELIILDDGEEPIEDLIPRDPRIKYIFEHYRRVTGNKRNRVNYLSSGEIICHFDDDDWSAADRVADQVARLAESGKPVTGYSILHFFDLITGKTLRYRSSVSGYVCGTTLCYTREFWLGRKFRDKHATSDNDFVYPILDRIAASKDARHMVARIHNCHHTSNKAGIREGLPRQLIPPEFWDNDRLRLP